MDIKEAVVIAKNYVRYVFSIDDASDIALEEVDFTHSKDEWLITVSFTRKFEPNHGIAVLRSMTRGRVTMPNRREQRVVRMNSMNGEVLSVKIREPSMAA